MGKRAVRTEKTVMFIGLRLDSGGELVYEIGVLRRQAAAGWRRAIATSHRRSSSPSSTPGRQAE